jgi:hypothetical protein
VNLIVSWMVLVESSALRYLLDVRARTAADRGPPFFHGFSPPFQTGFLRRLAAMRPLMSLWRIVHMKTRPIPSRTAPSTTIQYMITTPTTMAKPTGPQRAGAIQSFTSGRSLRVLRAVDEYVSPAKRQELPLSHPRLEGKQAQRPAATATLGVSQWREPSRNTRRSEPDSG